MATRMATTATATRRVALLALFVVALQAVLPAALAQQCGDYESEDEDLHVDCLGVGSCYGYFKYCEEDGEPADESSYCVDASMVTQDCEALIEDYKTRTVAIVNCTTSYVCEEYLYQVGLTGLDNEEEGKDGAGRLSATSLSLLVALAAVALSLNTYMML